MLLTLLGERQTQEKSTWLFFFLFSFKPGSYRKEALPWEEMLMCCCCSGSAEHWPSGHVEGTGLWLAPAQAEQINGGSELPSHVCWEFWLILKLSILSWTNHEPWSLCSPEICIVVLTGFKLMIEQVGPSFAYLILRSIPSLLYIEYELSNV